MRARTSRSAFALTMTAAMLAGASLLPAQSAADTAGITAAARDYITGWYDGDAARTERALHPQLAKRIVRAGPDGRSTLGHMTSAELVSAIRSGSGRSTPAARRRSDIRILDLFGNTASVRVDAADWVDYLHIAKSDGRWVIVNVLWELRAGDGRTPARSETTPTAPAATPAQQPAPTRQGTTASIRAELLGQFDASMSKVIALAGAMPSTAYAWKPEPAAMPVGQVYGHIARYNFYYPASAMGIAAPSGIGLDTLEAMRDRTQLVQVLRRSADHVRTSIAGMSNEELERPTTLYGRTVPRWAVLLQLVTHMNEHLGQSIAYARSNSVVPPWSR